MNLNLDWTFLQGEDENAWFKGYDDSHWRNVNLPHDWSVEAPFSKKHSSGTGYLPGGIGWYRKTFNLPPDIKNKKVELTIEGAYNNVKVWVNSYYLGHRPYGYSTFSYDLSEFIKEGDNCISIRLNHDSTSDSRWFTGSGIYRNVYLKIKEKIHIDQNGVFYQTEHCNAEEATINIENQLKNETKENRNVVLVNSLTNKEGKIVAEVTTKTNLASNRSKTVSESMKVTQPRLWSPNHPHLYKLETTLYDDNQIVDSETTQIGIRSIRFDSQKGFFLNDKRTVFKGVCIHHDAGALGAAVPKDVWKRRLTKFKELGANAIRMSHNPPAPDLLDLCDEMGFLVIDEAFDEWEGSKNKWSTGHNVYPPKHDGYYEYFPQWAERDLKDLVLRDRNHPSIIAWSIGNEIDYPNDPYCHPLFQQMTGNNDKNKPKQERQYDANKPNAERLVPLAKRLVGYVKEVDQTRPVTAALAFPELSNLIGLSDTLDVVGYNYKEHLYEEDHRSYPDRVLYGSENGHSLEHWLDVIKHPFISGQFLWTGIDFLGEAHGWPIRGSQAGLLDLAGFEKPKFYFRKSLWTDTLFCKLTVRKKGSSNEEFKWDFKNEEEVLINSYSNADYVECFINGESLGQRQISQRGENISWKTAFKHGEVKLVAKNKDGQMVEERIETPNHDKYYLKAISDKEILTASGEDVSQIEVMMTDCKGKKVIDDNEVVKVDVEGPIELMGIENGDISDLTPYFETYRKFYNGQLLVYVKSKTEEGVGIVHLTTKRSERTQVRFSVRK